MISHIHSKHSNIDILINNAGRAQAGGVLDTSVDQWQDMMNLKILAMTNLCKLVIPKMIKKKWGRIVNVSSKLVKEPNNNLVQLIMKNVGDNLHSIFLNISKISEIINLLIYFNQIIEKLIQLKNNKIHLGRYCEVLIENKLKGQEKYFGMTQFMTPVIFESDNCKPGELVNVKITSFNRNNLFGFHKMSKMKAA